MAISEDFETLTICPCKPGYIGSRCDVCDVDVGYALVLEECALCVQDCGPFGTRVCSDAEPEGLCSCATNFFGDRCEKCEAAECGEGHDAQCVVDPYMLTLKRCVCDPNGLGGGWDKDPALQPSAGVRDLRPCGVCGSAWIDDGAGGCVSIGSFCGAHTNLSETKGENACVCADGFWSTSPPESRVPLTRGDTVFSCTSAVGSDLPTGCGTKGWAVDRAETARTNTCVCVAETAIATAKGCEVATDVCGPGVQLTPGGGCACEEERWLPLADQATGRCVTCREGFQGPSCLGCSETCVGNSVCGVNATTQELTCTCIHGFQKDPTENKCTECAPGFVGDSCISCPYHDCGEGGSCQVSPVDPYRSVCGCNREAGWHNAVSDDPTSPCSVCKANAAPVVIDAAGTRACANCAPACAGRGTCKADDAGTQPVCSCFDGRTGALCTHCADGYGGPECVPCPSSIANSCNNTETCRYVSATRAFVCRSDASAGDDDDDDDETHIAGQGVLDVRAAEGGGGDCVNGWAGPSCASCVAEPCMSACGPNGFPFVDVDVDEPRCLCDIGYVATGKSNPCRLCDTERGESPTLCRPCPLCPSHSHCVDVRVDATTSLQQCHCDDGYVKLTNGTVDPCYPRHLLAHIRNTTDGTLRLTLQAEQQQADNDARAESFLQWILDPAAAAQYGQTHILVLLAVMAGFSVLFSSFTTVKCIHRCLRGRRE